jgi:hypothetical protein
VAAYYIFFLFFPFFPARLQSRAMSGLGCAAAQPIKKKKKK